MQVGVQELLADPNIIDPANNCYHIFKHKRAEYDAALRAKEAEAAAAVAAKEAQLQAVREEAEAAQAAAAAMVADAGSKLSVLTEEVRWGVGVRCGGVGTGKVECRDVGGRM